MINNQFVKVDDMGLFLDKPNICPLNTQRAYAAAKPRDISWFRGSFRQSSLGSVDSDGGNESKRAEASIEKSLEFQDDKEERRVKNKHLFKMPEKMIKKNSELSLEAPSIINWNHDQQQDYNKSNDSQEKIVPERNYISIEVVDDPYDNVMQKELSASCESYNP